MRAVARLIWLYVAATPLQSGLLILGLGCISAGLAGYLYYPTWSLGTGMRNEALSYQLLVLLAPWVGLMLLFFASAQLPTIVERLARGRSILVLPGGRVCVVLSAIATAGTIALVTTVAGRLSFFYYPSELVPENLLGRMFVVTFSSAGLMYVALWLVGKTSGVWRLMGSLLVIFCVVLPMGLIGRPVGVPPLVWLGAIPWVAFATLLLFGSRLKHAFADRGLRAWRAARRRLPGTRYSAGDELALLLGTTNPWIVAVGQVVPIAAAVWWIPQANVLLFFLTIFGAISGAITSTAAARSRALWLRFHWTRAEIFDRVETAFWRNNVYALGVLLLLFVAIGNYREFATPVLALGIVLLATSSLASSYLGLLMTRGLRWRETALGLVTMGLIMAAAIAVNDTDSGVMRAIVLNVVLAAVAVIYRFAAKRRWIGLDWMLCRPPLLARGGAG